MYIADTAPRLASIAKSPDSSPASFIAGSGQRVRASGVEAIGSHVLDLASVKTASESAQKFLELEDRLDIVLAAAGVMQLSQSELSPDGWERTWAITHLGHFVFLNTLLRGSLLSYVVHLFFCVPSYWLKNVFSVHDQGLSV